MHLLKTNKTKDVILLMSILLLMIVGVTYSIKASNNHDNNQSALIHGDDETSIRVALLLDTSGSMSGLIEQTKSQLWNILNELNEYQIKGETPRILISLYEYGHGSYGASLNYMTQILPFTTDMDLVSDKLFQFRTNGSEEYCGQVIHNSIQELEWGHNEEDLRLIYLAGNESIHQGRVTISSACKEARERDIVINTIFCGDRDTGIELGWMQGATLGKGEYLYIDHNHETVYYESPYDDEIQKLNSRLNQTFIPMGSKGKTALENMYRQDDNANRYSKSNAADRTSYKISKNYRSSSWDLVDAYEADANVIKEKSQLPEDYQGLSDKEIEMKIEEKQEERAEIKDQIKALQKKRDYHIAEEKELKEEEPSDLQQSIIKSVEQVAKQKKYKK